MTLLRKANVPDHGDGDDDGQCDDDNMHEAYERRRWIVY